jgi:hypothetical protein
MERDNARKALSELQDEVNKKIKERQDVAESTCIYVVFREALEIFNQAIDSRKVKG